MTDQNRLKRILSTRIEETMRKYQYIYKKHCSNCNHKFAPDKDRITEDTEEIDMPPYYKTYVVITCSQCRWGTILDQTDHLEHP